MKLFVLLFLGSLVSGTGNARTYYFSSSGDDAAGNNNKSTPWRSLKKLSQVYLVPGDSILFERGGTFTGQLTVTYSTIYAGAYGTGTSPVINGLVTVNQWMPAGKNIWKTTCEDCLTDPGNLFIDGKLQPLGRYPNTGYLTVSGSERSKISLTDSALHVADGYWNNAEIVVRTSRWTLDNVPVRSHSRKTFLLGKPTSYEIQNGFGYFIQRHRSTLDTNGEWFYDKDTHELFLFLKSGTTPQGHTIEISINELGLSLKNVHHITIENLAFDGHRTTGIRMEKCSTVTLRNVTISNSGTNGLEVISCQHTEVENSIIADSNNNGVSWRNSEGIFTNNSILRTGIHAGRGVSGNGTYIAFALISDGGNQNNRLENNRIDSTGYIGIDFRSGNTSIKNNIISNFCILKDDGAGIYTWLNTHGGNTIEGNTIHHGHGAPQGTTNPAERFASGIYIDDKSADILIKNNQVSFCSTAGIFLHNAKNITITGNTVFSNGYNFSNKEKGQLYIKLDTLGQMGGNTALHLDVSQNKWAAGHETSYCVFLSAKKKQDLQKLGVFSQNQFSAIQARQVVAEMYTEAGLCPAPIEFSLSDWAAVSGYEDKSVFAAAENKSVSTVGVNLVKNGDMALGKQGWIAWPEPSALSAAKTKEPSLKIDIPENNTEALLYHAGFPLSKNKLYRLSFTARSSVAGKLEFVPLMAGAPWQALGLYTCFSIDPSAKTFTYYFQPYKNCAEARVNFKSNSSFWISNVSLYEVTDHTKSN